MSVGTRQLGSAGAFRPDRHSDKHSADMAASIAFQSIVLRESDVPGAKLVYESIEKHSNIQ